MVATPSPSPSPLGFCLALSAVIASLVSVLVDHPTTRAASIILLSLAALLLGYLTLNSFGANTRPSELQTEPKSQGFTASSNSEDSNSYPTDTCTVTTGVAIASQSFVEQLRRTDRFDEEQLGVVEALYESVSKYDESTDISVDMNVCKIEGYQLGEPLGRGGYGVVYEAFGGDYANTVAIKLVADAEATERFRHEMHLVQRLAHPNFVVAYSAGEIDGVLYIVMERLEGPNLQIQVKEKGPVDWEQSLGIIKQAALALTHAHSRGLIHRDVKPGNLMWDGDRIKITDLGLATLISDRARKQSSSERSIAGTPHFMAPEQARGLTHVDERSDIYSLGATWLYLVTGESRIREKKLEHALKILAQGEFQEPDISALPVEVQNVLGRMLQYDPADRFQSMEHVVDAIDSLIPSCDREEGPGGVSVLLVEDNEDDLVLTAELLRRGNNSVSLTCATTLQESITLCEEPNAFDVVLLDLQLPDSSGVSTVESLRAQLPDVPIVVLTGQSDIAVGEACVQAGADDFAYKGDLDVHRLERTIFIAISRFQKRGEDFSDNTMIQT